MDGELYDIENILLPDLQEEWDKLSSEGFRVLAVAYKNIDVYKEVYTKDDETELVLKSYLAFLDPLKPQARKAITALKKLGIDIKILTGDHELITKKICAEVGLDIKGLVTGDKLDNLSDTELQKLAAETTVFARLSPLQKERVIQVLRNNNHTVGYLGDGINDAPAQMLAFQ